MPLQTVEALPAFAVGNGLTVMVILLTLLQPVAVIVSVNVYVVAAVGETDGFDIVEVKPTGFDTQL